MRSWYAQRFVWRPTLYLLDAREARSSFIFWSAGFERGGGVIPLGGLERIPDSWDVTRVASGSGDAHSCINISPTPPVRLRVCAICCADVRGRMSSFVRGTRRKGERGKQGGGVRQQRGGEGRGSRAINRNVAAQLRGVCGTRDALYMLAGVRGNCSMNQDGHLCSSSSSRGLSHLIRG